MANEELTKKYIQKMTEAGTSSEAAEAKKQRHRSPAYTSIGLNEAVEKARIIWEHEKLNEVAIDVAAGHWGAAPKSSTTLMAFSALKKFGLITDRGSGDRRYVKLTDLAYQILKAELNSPTWVTFVQKAALMPPIIAELWELDKESPKSTPSLKRYLDFEKHFNPAVIDEFIQSYKDTISFAKLGIGDTVLTGERDGAVVEFGRKNSEEESQPPAGRNIAVKENRENTQQSGKKMLAQYSIPLGSNEATLVFSGEKLSADDFDALGEFVVFAKKQFERKQKAEESKNLERAIFSTFAVAGKSIADQEKPAARPGPPPRKHTPTGQ